MSFLATNQPIFALICFSIGFVLGIFLSPVGFLSFFISSEKHKKYFCALELLAVAFLFVFLKNYYQMGEFRVYMGAICLIGFYIYKKTLGKSIAIFLKKLYNILCKRFTFRRKCKNDRRKIKKNSSGDNICGSNPTFYINSGYGLPNGNHKREKSKNR